MEFLFSSSTKKTQARENVFATFEEMLELINEMYDERIAKKISLWAEAASQVTRVFVFKLMRVKEMHI